MYKDNSEKGQTLIAVFFVMLIALSIGVTVSTRFIKSSSNIVISDNAYRALGVAEAALERILLVPQSTLAEYIENDSCGADCTLQIYDENGQVLSATIELSYMGDTTDTYSFNLDEGVVEEVSLVGYSSGSVVDVCWEGDASIYAVFVTETGAGVEADTYAYMPFGSIYGADGFDTATDMHGYTNCFSVSTKDVPQLLRIKALHDEADVYIVPAPGVDLPVQGILITSTGVFDDAQRRVQVLLTNPQVPDIFDYSLYQNTQDSPLSNSTL